MSLDNLQTLCDSTEVWEGLSILEPELPDRHSVVTEWLGEAGYAVASDETEEGTDKTA